MCGDNVRFYVDEKIEATTTADDEKDEFLILFCQVFFASARVWVNAMLLVTSQQRVE